MPVLGHERALSASVGTILGLFALAAAGVRVALPVLARGLHEWRVVSGAMLATALPFAVYPLTTAWSMGLCSMLLGLVLGSVQPMLMSTLHQITPPPARAGHRLADGDAQSLPACSLPMLFGTAWEPWWACRWFLDRGGGCGCGCALERWLLNRANLVTIGMNCRLLFFGVASKRLNGSSQKRNKVRSGARDHAFFDQRLKLTRRFRRANRTMGTGLFSLHQG